MRFLSTFFVALVLIFSFHFCSSQTIQDDFEGNGNISNWFGDDCTITEPFANPQKKGINTSSNVLLYEDLGGDYANVRFDLAQNISFSSKTAFSVKVYVPSNLITGSQTNQISLKLQDGKIAEPWTTQSEIIKSIKLDEWQTVVFDFKYDQFKNLDPASKDPIERTDFNRVVIQLNGENNKDNVTCYIDDFEFIVTNGPPANGLPVYSKLVWSDEFSGQGMIDTSKWFHQTLLPDGNSWFNGEIQHYTNRLENTFQSLGSLNLVAQKETFTDQGVTKNYTSARLNSKYAFTYGRVEVRAQLPKGVGTWPAIWMLGKNIDENGTYWQKEFGTTGWPQCGEIDIMEHWGDNQDFVQSAMHTPSSSGNTINKGGKLIPGVSDNYHVYAVDWHKDRMVFSYDSAVVYIYKPNEITPSIWPFTADQFILLNIAIEPQIASSFVKSSMLIDYVRVYEEEDSTMTNLQEAFDRQLDAQLYPNPVSNQLNLELMNRLGNTNWCIYSLSSGVKVKSGVISSPNTNIDVEFLKSGVYAIQFNDFSSTIVKRFIKE